MESSNFRSYCTGALSVFLILATASAHAGLVRGGGRSSASAPVRSGLASYLLPTSVENAYNLYNPGDPGLFELPADFDPAAEFAGYAKYDFNEGYQGGWPIQSHLNWGQDCEQPGQTPTSTLDDPDFYDCFFELATDEVFEFSGHAIGLPGPGVFPGNPMLDFSWILQDSLGVELRSWGLGDAGVSQGGLFAFDASITEDCFAVWQPHLSGYCQLFDINTGLTGSELLALSGGEGLRLSLEVSITADDGFGFYNYIESGPSDNLLKLLQPGGSISAEEGGLRLDETSVAMRIEVVPVPATGMLFAIGAAGLWFSRRRRRWQSVDGVLGIHH